VEFSVTVLVIAGFLMGVDGPIEEVDNLVLQARDTDTPRVEIEGHVLVTLDVHEVIVNLKNWVSHRPFLEISPKSCHVHIFFINLKLLNGLSIKN
jgi:hypothetical protein